MASATLASCPHVERSRRLLVCASFAVLLLAQLAHAQSPAQQPQVEPGKPGDTRSAPYSLHVNVPLVTLDVSVLTANGYFVPDLKRENFRLTEDGVPQKIAFFSERHAPITAVLLVEFNADVSLQQIGAVRASYSFTKALKNDDWTALLIFDKHLHIAQDKHQ